MKTPQQVVGEVVLAAIALVILAVALYLFGRKAVDTVQAPAKLEAALGNNAALAKGADAQNKAVDALVTASKTKKEVSAKAVAAAGKREEQRAKDILEARPVGESDYDRMVNRIDRELGLK